MDNRPSVSLHQEDFRSCWRALAAARELAIAAAGVYLASIRRLDREEIVRGMRVIGLNTRSLAQYQRHRQRLFVYNYMQSQVDGFSGTALGAFGSAHRIPAVDRGAFAVLRGSGSARIARRAQAVAAAAAPTMKAK